MAKIAQADRAAADTPRDGTMRLPVFGSMAALLLVAKLWMTFPIRIVPLFAPHDESNFLEHAKSLVSGQWLGSYDQYTLIKGPAFPIFVAAADALGVPLPLAHQLLYFGACVVACFAIRPMVRDDRVLAAILAFLLFNPYTYSRSAWFADRSQLAEAAALLTVASATGLYLRRNERVGAVVGWSCVLGCALATYSLTREDFMWLLPAIALVLAPVAVKAARAKGRRQGLLSAAIALPFLIALAANVAVAQINGRAYGWRTVVEIESPEYVGAYAALSRISAGPRVLRLPVSDAALKEAYAASAAARELRPALEGDVGAGWAYVGCHGGFICNGFAGASFLWVLRDAVASAGYYRSASKARDFYARLSTELDAACDAHRIPCGPLRKTMMPPISLSDVPLLVRSYAGGAGSFFALTAFGAFPDEEWSSGAEPIQLREDYRSVVRAIDPVFTDAANRERTREDGAEFAAQRMVARAYRDAVGWLAAAMLAFTLVRIVRARRDRFAPVADHVVAGLGTAVGVATFLCVLTLVDVYAFTGFRTEYFAVAYPGALFAIGAVAGVELPGAFRSIARRAGAAPIPAATVVVAACAAVVAISMLRRFDVSSSDSVPAPAGSVARPPLLFSPARIDALHASTQPALGSVDSVTVSPDGKRAIVAGWLADPATKAQAPGALLVVDGNARFNATPFYGFDRPDVARALSSTPAERTGIAQAPIWLSGIPAGTHVVQIGEITAGGSYRLTRSSRSFTF